MSKQRSPSPAAARGFMKSNSLLSEVDG